jgi:hypothetical protein
MSTDREWLIWRAYKKLSPRSAQRSRRKPLEISVIVVFSVGNGFERLKSILKPYEPKFTVKADTSEAYSLDGPYSQKWKKEIFFGATQIKKNYVSGQAPAAVFGGVLRVNHTPRTAQEASQGKIIDTFALYPGLLATTRLTAI